MDDHVIDPHAHGAMASGPGPRGPDHAERGPLPGWQIKATAASWAHPCLTAHENHTCTRSRLRPEAAARVSSGVLRLAGSATAADGPDPASALEEELSRLLGQPWDDELEPFRCAADGAPVRWLHATG